MDTATVQKLIDRIGKRSARRRENIAVFDTDGFFQLRKHQLIIQGILRFQPHGNPSIATYIIDIPTTPHMQRPI